MTNNNIAVNAAELKTALSSVIHAVPKRDPRKILFGVLFETDSDGLNLVGSGGKTLCRRRVRRNEGDDEWSEWSAVLPIEDAKRLKKALGSFLSVDVTLDDGEFRFDLPGSALIARALVGTFPPYRSVLPKNARPIDFPAGFDSRIMATALKSYGMDREFVLWGEGPRKPILLRQPNGFETDDIDLIMPKTIPGGGA